MTTERLIAIRSAPVVESAPAIASDAIPSLDGLRAVSIVLVLLSHCGLEAYFPGRFGVTIFFFLSGFLMTTLLLAEYAGNGRINLGHFYARRIFRLMPPLLIALTVTYLLVSLGVITGRVTWEVAGAQILYFANYYMLFSPNAADLPFGTGLLWSLSVEEHFYLIYPLFLMCALPLVRTRGALVALLAGICIATLAWRIYLFSLGAPDERTAFSTDTRVDSILFGCCLAVLYDARRPSTADTSMSTRHWIVLIGAILLLAATFAFRSEAFRATYRYSLQGIALLPIFYLAVRYAHQFPFRPLNWPLLGRIGVWSYSIYLIHEVGLGALVHFFPAMTGQPMMLVPAVAALSIAFAAAIDALVDPYFRRLRRKFRPRMAPSAR